VTAYPAASSSPRIGPARPARRGPGGASRPRAPGCRRRPRWPAARARPHKKEVGHNGQLVQGQLRIQLCDPRPRFLRQLRRGQGIVEPGAGQPGGLADPGLGSAGLPGREQRVGLFQRGERVAVPVHVDHVQVLAGLVPGPLTHQVKGHFVNPGLQRSRQAAAAVDDAVTVPVRGDPQRHQDAVGPDRFDELAGQVQVAADIARWPASRPGSSPVADPVPARGPVRPVPHRAARWRARYRAPARSRARTDPARLDGRA